MSRISAQITNPFIEEHNCSNSYSIDRKISKNKSIMAQIILFDFKTLFTFEIWHRDRFMDHKGLMFEIGLVGFSIILEFYDARHIDHY